MSLETFGKLYDIMIQSGIVVVAVVSNEKVTGLELTFVDGTVEQKLFQSITVKATEPNPEEKNVELPDVKT